MIVITTPAGQIGGQVLENLLGSGEHLRLVARDPSGIPAGTRQLVEVIEGSRRSAAVRRGRRGPATSPPRWRWTT
jgi:uncharacterized protein YbjT (DUF2867 family)